MNRRAFFGCFWPAAVIPPMLQPPAPEHARMMVHPVCPRCGAWAMFTERAQGKSVTHRLTVACECGWEGVSLRAVRQTPENGTGA